MANPSSKRRMAENEVIFVSAMKACNRGCMISK